MILMQKREWLALGLAALALLIIVNIYDYNVFSKWVIASYVLGPFHLYDAALLFGHEFRVVYPPLVPLMFIASVLPLVILNPRLVLSPVPPLVVRAVLKIPILASYYAMYLLLRRRYGREAAMLFATSVASVTGLLVYTSDMPATLLALLALETVDVSVVLSGFLLAVAILLKQVWILLLPPLALYAYWRKGGRVAGKLLASLTLTTLIIATPFVIFNGATTIIDYVIAFHAKRLPQGLNPWVLSLYLTGYNAELAARVSRLWIIPFLAAVIYTLYRFLRSTPTRQTLLVAVAAILTAFLAFSKVVNPVYPLWVIPILAILAARDARLRKAFTAVNIAALLLAAHFALYYISAAVSYKPIYIEEEARWISAKEVEELVVYVWPAVLKPVLSFLRESPARYVFLAIYESWPYIASSLAITYTILMLTAFRRLTSALGGVEGRKDGYRAKSVLKAGWSTYAKPREDRTWR